MYTLDESPTASDVKALKDDHGQTYDDVADMLHTSVSGVKKWAVGVRAMPVGLWQLWLLKLGEIELNELEN